MHPSTVFSAFSPLKNFKIGVGMRMLSCSFFDPKGYSLCVHVSGRLRIKETRNLTCDEPVQGRYVTVYMEQPEIQALCEVEVYGSGEGLPGGLLLLYKFSKSGCKFQIVWFSLQK